MQRLAGIRRLERNARRWQLVRSRWIYEVTGPRYALSCFATHVEAGRPDNGVGQAKVMIAAHEMGLADRLHCVRTVVGGTTPRVIVNCLPLCSTTSAGCALRPR